MLTPEERRRLLDLIPYATPQEYERIMDILRLETEEGEDTQDVSFLEYCRRTCPFELDPWQMILCSILQDAFDNPGQRIMIHAPPQVGKPCHVDSMVMMGDGTYRRLGDIVEGDFVMTHKGRPRRVMAVYEQGELKCLKITTVHGRETVAALDHPFLTPEGYVKASDLHAGMCLANLRKAEVSSPGGHSDDEFELLGYFMGDGSCGPAGPSIHAGITSADPAQAERFIGVAARMGFSYRTDVKPGSKGVTYHFRHGIRKWLRSTGIAGCTSGFKHIPDWVYQGTDHQVALFLGSYFSCDGTVFTKGMARNGGPRQDATIEFYSISKPLLQGVQRLLLRLGVQSKLSPKNGKYKGESHHSWRLTFASQSDVAQFAASVPVYGVKGDKLRALRSVRKTFPGEYLNDQIKSVEAFGLGECRCLRVEEDCTFTVDDLIVHNTVIVSERFPAWCIGRKPKIRFVSAAYNETHAQGFGHAVKNLMLSEEHNKMFPSSIGKISKRASTQSFRTPARDMINDGQYSFLAVGINTGFTGKGADIMVIDDPYASDEMATSPATNEKTWRFWEKTCKQRVLGASVIVVFHRYHADDFAARLMEREVWKCYRFSLRADDNPDGDDPTGRQIGEMLTPRRTVEDAEEWERTDLVGYMGQGQGRPLTSIAQLINPDHLNYWNEDKPPAIRFWYRSYDLALVKTSPDETASFLMGMTDDGRVYVDDIQHWHKDIKDTEDVILDNAKHDPPGTFVCLYNENVHISTIGRLRMHERINLVEVKRANRDKWACAAGWAAQAARGKVLFSKACRELPYFKVQCSRFNNLPTDRDDLIDAFSAAYESTYRHRAKQDTRDESIHPDSPAYFLKLIGRGQRAVSREQVQQRAASRRY